MKHFKTLLLLFFVALFSCENPVDPPNPPETFTVTYFSSGHESGDIPVDSMAYENGMTVSVKGNSGTLIRTGYTFNGWNTEPGFNGVSRTPGSTFTMGSSDVSLYAEWTANSYTVTFDYQDGVSETTTATVEYDSAYGALPGPSRVGYTLMGWYTDTSFITEVTASTILSTASDHTLYAKWSTQVISVSFDAQSGSFTNSQAKTKNVEFDAAYGSLPEVTRTGYTFLGWFTQPDGLGVQVTSSTIVSNPTGHSLYAAWQVQQYTLTFISEIGQPPYNSLLINFDQEFGALPTPLRSGFQFDGWYFEQDHSGTKISSTSTLVLAEDTTVYAKWIQEFTVSFDSSGGSTIESQLVLDGDLIIEPTDPVLASHTFEGWYTDNTFATIWNFSTDVVSSDQNLVAKWIQYEFTITFDSNSGSSVETVVVQRDQLISEPAEPTRIGYNFKGWFTDNTFTTEWDFSVDKPSRNITFVAKWEAISITFMENADDAVGTMNNQFIPHSTSYNLDTCNFTRTGYHFMGWSTTVDGSVEYKNAASFTMGTSDVILYAQWTPEVIDISVFNNSTFFLKYDGTLWATGQNDTGLLGDGTTDHKYVPVKIMDNVKQMSMGNKHCLILKKDGSAWAAGDDTYGQFGINVPGNESHIPLQVLTDVKAVYAGHYVSFFLKNDNSLWCAGTNDCGNLGQGSTGIVSFTRKIMDDVQEVAASNGSYNMILKTDGTVWVSGKDYYGEHGDGTKTDKTVFTQIMSDVKSVVASGAHTLFLKTDNTVWASGNNGSGQLGDNSKVNKSTAVQVMTDVSSIYAGKYTSVFIKTDNTVWASGSNNGRFGNGETEGSQIPVQISSGVKNIWVGTRFIILQKNDGSVWGSGSISGGEFGNGNTELNTQYLYREKLYPNDNW